LEANAVSIGVTLVGVIHGYLSSQLRYHSVIAATSNHHFPDSSNLGKLA